jgi:hypothetical protein
MPTFYLDDSLSLIKPEHVPAGGMYYYTRLGSAKLQEQLIGINGKPIDDPERTRTVDVVLPQPDPEEWWPGKALPGKNWLLQLSDGQGAYLGEYMAMRPIDRDPPIGLWRGLVTPKRGSPQEFMIDSRLNRALVSMLVRRWCDGYERAGIWANKRLNERLVINSLPFWRCLRSVGKGLIENMDTALKTPARPRGVLFRHPLRIFQLNRVLAEGFIEGHVEELVTEKGSYAVEQTSINAWKFAIGRAAGRGGALALDDPQGNEVEMFDLLDRALPLSSPRGIISRAGYRLITPGSGEEQTLTFWGLHYPHWFADLVYAVRGLRRVGLVIEDDDLMVIAGVIANTLRNDPDVIAGSSATLIDILYEVLGMEVDFVQEKIAAILRELRAKA